MAFSIPESTRLIMTGIVSDIWNNTQGLLAPVTIYKEPLKTVNASPSNFLPGYGDASASQQEVTFVPQFQVFSGQIIYPNSPKGGANFYFDTKIKLDPNSVYLRSKGEDIFNYLSDGQKIEKIEGDGKTWNYKGKTQIQNFLDLKYYFFELEATY